MGWMLRRHVIRACTAAGGLLPWGLHVQAEAPPSQAFVVPTAPTTAPQNVNKQQLPAADSASASGTAPNSSSSSSGSPATPAASPQRPKYREGEAFAVYTGAGNPSTLLSIVRAMGAADVVLLGEYHDDPVAHALQLQLLKRAIATYHDQLPLHQDSTAAAAAATPHHPQLQQSLGRSGATPAAPGPGAACRPVLLSLEMFETDVQVVMDEYLAGHIREQDFLKDARPWPNYKQDYHPLVALCKAHGCHVICANAPRRYVSAVGRQGAAVLSRFPPTGLQLLPPLPLQPPSQAYANKVAGSMRAAAEQMQAARRAAADVEVDKPGSPQGSQPPLTPSRDGDVVGGSVAEATTASSSSSAAPEAAAAALLAAGAAAAAAAGGGGGTGPPAAATTAAAAGGVSEDAGGCPYIGLTVDSAFLEAQNLWDATMAFSISRALRQQQQKQPPPLDTREGAGAASMQPTELQLQEQQQVEPLVIHVCGKFHCEGRLGIPEHLQHYSSMGAAGASPPRVMVVVFSPQGQVQLSQQELSSRGLLGAGDFVVVTDGSLPRSFSSVHL